MRVATWNINGLRARLDLVLRWLADRQPDVVGLQELKMADEKFPRAEIESAGYHAVTHGQKAWNGVAILSREMARVTQTGLPDQESFGSRLITAEIGELSFTTVYCPNGKHLDHEDYPRKLAWFDALIEHQRERHDPSRPAVVCGDFNICPAPIDSWNEEMLGETIFHSAAERDRVRRLLDGIQIDAVVDSAEVVSQTDTEAFVMLEGSLSMGIDIEVLTPFIESLLVASGMEVTPEMVDQMSGMMAAQFEAETLEISEEVRVVPGEDGRWLVCDELGSDDMAEDDMADDMAEDDMAETPDRKIDLLDRALYENDPQPTYTWLRNEAPVYWDETNEVWAISRHEDIVKILASVRDARDGEYVTVDSVDESVRIAKEGEYLTLHVEETHDDAETVDVRVPVSVLDALVSGDDDELDLLAAVRALGEHEDEAFVRVQETDATVRIWIDRQNQSD